MKRGKKTKRILQESRRTWGHHDPVLVWGSAVFSSSASKPSRPARLKPPSIYCWAWRTSLAYRARVTMRITKAYQQFLPMEQSLKKKEKKKKGRRDNIKGTTLISGEHVKPCNETHWKCLITAREMKLQDDSLIKQWLRIFCLLSSTVCNAF